MRIKAYAKYWLPAIAALAGTCGIMAQQSRRVDDALLKTGSRDGSELVAYGTNWAEQRYSPLNQITADNIGRLGLEKLYEVPFAPPPNGGANAETHIEATPLVFNGVLYSITPWSIVYAVDLRTMKELWRSDPQVNQQVWRSRICCGVVNRGIALYEGKVIAPVVDGRMRALDAATGRVLWETRIAPDDLPYTATMAPRVIKGGLAVVGLSGGEYAVRGFFVAVDVNTGRLAWRFYTVPGDPSKPQEHPDLDATINTWSKEHKWWELGGGAGVWNGFAYDDVNDIVYVGTGQPGPWTDHWRGPGDNLYANSIVAVRGATGKYVWHYQEVPGDNWDYDSIADLMLLDLPIGGRTRQVIMHAPKSGFFYILDRVTGEFLSADPITKVSWAAGYDAKGKAIVNEGAKYRTTSITVNPGPSGGHVWAPWTYNPQTRLVYFPGTAGQGGGYAATPTYTPRPGAMNMGYQMGGRGGGRGGAAAAPADTALPGNVAAAGATGNANPAAAPPSRPEPLPLIGPDGVTGSVLYAWDPVARKEAWRAPRGGAGPFAGGSISTAGNLVFSSVNNALVAFNATTGARIMDLDLRMNQMGPPISIMLDGKQYIVVTGAQAQVGGGGGRGGGGGQVGAAPATPAAPAGPRPALLMLLSLDGKLPIPNAPPAAAAVPAQ
jgi:quinohemoprotein ethanol dehydrogenase